MIKQFTRMLMVFSLGLLFTIPLYPQAPAAGRVQTIQERTAGMQKLDGFFPVYWDERTGSMWLEIPRFDTEVLYTAGLAAGLGSNDIGLDRGVAGAAHV